MQNEHAERKRKQTESKNTYRTEQYADCECVIYAKIHSKIAETTTASIYIFWMLLARSPNGNLSKPPSIDQSTTFIDKNFSPVSVPISHTLAYRINSDDGVCFEQMPSLIGQKLLEMGNKSTKRKKLT